MRVADAFRYQLYQTTLSNLKAQMDQSTQEIASGKQVMVPSDNPSSYAQNLQILAEQSQNSQYKSNLDSLQALGSYYTTSVNQVGNILSSVQQLATEQASSTVNADSRTSAAETVNDLIQQLVTLGNTKVGDTYIFGGTKSNTPAYSANGTFVGFGPGRSGCSRHLDHSRRRNLRPDHIQRHDQRGNRYVGGRVPIEHRYLWRPQAVQPGPGCQ